MELLIKKMGNDGEGIAYYNKKEVFIYYAYLNELVEVELFLNKRGVYEGRLLKVIKPSPHRISNLMLDDANLIHITYEESLNYKKNQIYYLFNKYLKGLNYYIKINNIIPSNTKTHYRNKSELPIKFINNKNKIGLFKRGTNQFIPTNDSILDSKYINDTYTLVTSLLDKYKINAFEQRNNKGFIISLSIRNNLDGDIQLTFVTKKDIDLVPIATEINKINPKINSIYHNYVKDFKTNRDIYNGNLKLIFGNKYLEMKLDKYTFLLTPFSFFQLHTMQALTLYKEIIKIAGFNKKDIILDAFSGVGTIATLISPLVKEVIAVESIKDAYNDLNKSLKINNISNIRAIVGDINKMHKYIKDDFNTLIFDPPRAGLGDDLINFILNKKVNKIIYVSCNPITLFRDLKKLSDLYLIKSITPIDMFPSTSHIETITLLQLKH